jgi:hypothetical protein
MAVELEGSSVFHADRAIKKPLGHYAARLCQRLPFSVPPSYQWMSCAKVSCWDKESRHRRFEPRLFIRRTFECGHL